MDKIKQKVLDSIQSSLEQGYTIVKGNWGDTDMHCTCAMGCVLIQNEVDDLRDDTSNFEAIQKLLNVSETWLSSFLDGFDGLGERVWANESEAWDLGKEVSEKYSPVEFDKFIDSLEE